MASNESAIHINSKPHSHQFKAPFTSIQSPIHINSKPHSHQHIKKCGVPESNATWTRSQLRLSRRSRRGKERRHQSTIHLSRKKPGLNYEEYCLAGKIVKKNIRANKGKLIDMLATETENLREIDRRGNSPRNLSATVHHQQEAV